MAVGSTKKALIAVGLTWIGFVAGLAFGLLRLPEGSGLAGPTILLGNGIAGALLGFVLGLFLALRRSTQTLAPMARLVAICSLLAVAAIMARVIAVNNQRQAKLEAEEVARTTPFEVRAEILNPRDGADFTEIMIDGRTGAFSLSAKKPDNLVCSGEIDERQRARILRALRPAEAVLESNPSLCATTVNPLRRLSWSLPENGGTERSIAIDSDCATDHGGFSALYTSLQAVAFSATRGHQPTDCVTSPE